MSHTYIALLFFFLFCSCVFREVLWCVVRSVTYIVLVFFGRRLMCGCVLLISFSCFFWGGKKVVQRIVEVVADYEDHVNLTVSSAPAA